MPEKRADEVFSVRAAHYATSKVHDDAVVLSRVVEWSSPRPTFQTLDVGTGTWHTAMALAPRVRMVIALDMTKEMLSKGAELAQERGILNIHPCLGDAQSLPFSDGTMDVVTCRRAAHHFPDLSSSLQEMQRVLKAGGALVIDDRSVPESIKFSAFINHLDSLHDPSHVRERSLSEWRSLLKQAELGLVTHEEYVRHRTFSSYTQAVEPERRALMTDHLATADQEVRNEINLVWDGSEPSWDHFFVTILARKA